MRSEIRRPDLHSQYAPVRISEQQFRYCGSFVSAYPPGMQHGQELAVPEEADGVRGNPEQVVHMPPEPQSCMVVPG